MHSSNIKHLTIRKNYKAILDAYNPLKNKLQTYTNNLVRLAKMQYIKFE